MKFNCIFNQLEKNHPITRSIFHYCGHGFKPHPDMKSPYNRLWFKYFMKTPFCTPDSFGNIWNQFEGIILQYIDTLNRMDFAYRNLLYFSEKCDRVLVIDPKSTNLLAKLIYHKESDVILYTDVENILQLLVKFLNDGKIAFIESASLFSRQLSALGFQQNVDFFDMMFIIPHEIEVNFNDIRDQISRNM